MYTRRHFSYWISQVLLTILVATGFLQAQTDRGTITGTVADSSGAVLVGAKVTAANKHSHRQCCRNHDERLRQLHDSATYRWCLPGNDRASGF